MKMEYFILMLMEWKCRKEKGHKNIKINNEIIVIIFLQTIIL